MDASPLGGLRRFEDFIVSPLPSDQQVAPGVTSPNPPLPESHFEPGPKLPFTGALRRKRTFEDRCDAGLESLLGGILISSEVSPNRHYLLSGRQLRRRKRWATSTSFCVTYTATCQSFWFVYHSHAPFYLGFLSESSHDLFFTNVRKQAFFVGQSPAYSRDKDWSRFPTRLTRHVAFLSLILCSQFFLRFPRYYVYYPCIENPLVCKHYRCNLPRTVVAYHRPFSFLSFHGRLLLTYDIGDFCSREDVKITRLLPNTYKTYMGCLIVSHFINVHLFPSIVLSLVATPTQTKKHRVNLKFPLNSTVSHW